MKGVKGSVSFVQETPASPTIVTAQLARRPLLDDDAVGLLLACVLPSAAVPTAPPPERNSRTVCV